MLLLESSHTERRVSRVLQRTGGGCVPLMHFLLARHGRLRAIRVI